MLDPIYENVDIGKAEVLQIFKLRRGVIAGSRIIEGIAKRNALATTTRNGAEIIPETKIETLRRFEEDVTEVRTGFECGIRLATNSTDLKEGDIINIYESQRVR
jgi:translation initiation factor IF-2